MLQPGGKNEKLEITEIYVRICPVTVLLSFSAINNCVHSILFSVLFPGKRGQKHVLPPAGEDDEPDDEDAVVSLEWDPLSTEYLLVANAHSGVRLVDTAALTTIQRFQLPSAATQVQTLDWIDSAPGMFVTGGELKFKLD